MQITCIYQGTKNLALFWQSGREPIYQCIKQHGHEEAEDSKNYVFLICVFKILAAAMFVIVYSEHVEGCILLMQWVLWAEYVQKYVSTYL